jgi:hypothetical protein
MDQTKPFCCPECNHRIDQKVAWLLTVNTLVKCKNCHKILIPEKSITRLIAVLVSINCAILATLFGYLGFSYQGIGYGILYGILIGVASFFLLFILNRKYITFKHQISN